MAPTIPLRNQKKKKQEQQQVSTNRQINLQTPLTGEKVLTSAERAALIKTYPAGTILDKFGNVVQRANATEQEKTARRSEGIKKANQIPTDEQILKERTGQEQVQQAIIDLSQPPNITEQDILNAVPQEETLENIQAGGAGVAGGVAGGFAGAAAGAKLGALGGTAIAPGLGTAIGAIGGAIVGAIGASYSKISYDRRQDVKQAFVVANTANTNFGQTIDALNAGVITKDVALERFREDRIALYSAHANLKRETDTNINRFLSGGADELAKVEDQINDLEQIYSSEFLLALNDPNPARVKYIQNNGVEE